MDFRDTTANNGQKVSLTITSALLSAFLEWLLIFMLFVDACFSYMVTRFARRYQLQIPCLFCSRLDHVLGNERVGFCWDLICCNHKSKISSLIFCRRHNKLVDVHETCDHCYFSFATVNKLNEETNRLLVGKLGAEPYNMLTEGSENQFNSSDTKKCFCCSQQWISITYPQKLFTTKSTSSEIVTPEYTRNGVQEMTDRVPKLHHTRSIDMDPLPHVEYKRISTVSENESEARFSDNESMSAVIPELEIPDQNSAVKHAIPEPQVFLSSCQGSEKLIDPARETVSLLDSETNIDSLCIEEPKPPQTQALELILKHTDLIDDLSLPSQPTLPSDETSGMHEDDCKETIVDGPTELGQEVNSESRDTPKLDSDFKGTDELRKEVTLESAETSMLRSDSISTTEIQVVSKHSESDNQLYASESLELGDAYKLAIGTRGRQLSGKFLQQQKSITDSTRVSGDLKALLSQVSFARGFESSFLDISPRISSSSEDYNTVVPFDAMQILQRRMSLERNESNLSLDESALSEIEGESVLDRLQRQVEHDKKIMGALYKELEEERNASAVAVNQAMAMITRLQEEKAALYTEALQSLRVMEEQSEYDSEALQKANDALFEREKQIQDLEAELALLRNHSNSEVHETPDVLLDENSTIRRIQINDEVFVDVSNGDLDMKKEFDASASDELNYKKISREYGEKSLLLGETLVRKETLLEDTFGHENSESENIGKFLSI